METFEKEIKVIHGEVVNCSKLNVRASASKQSPVKCLVSKGDILQIEPFNSGWFKVVAPSGINGFCRKEFIEEK